MAVKTTLAQLEEVQTAITAILTGAQSATLGDKTITRAQLGVLQEREQTLLNRYYVEQAAGEAGGFVNKVKFADPT